jgi:hypothetical protein
MNSGRAWYELLEDWLRRDMSAIGSQGLLDSMVVAENSVALGKKRVSYARTIVLKYFVSTERYSLTHPPLGSLYNFLRYIKKAPAALPTCANELCISRNSFKRAKYL